MMNLKSNASNIEILEALKNVQSGISFLTPHPSLPSQTFVSADAAQWLNNHIEGGVNIQQAIKIMEVSYLLLTYCVHVALETVTKQILFYLRNN